MADLTYNEFAEWLFPGDELPVKNPSAIPGAAQDILEQVSCATGVPNEWLKRSARLVLDGIAGAQCLWYLHGLEGKLEEDVGSDLSHGLPIGAIDSDQVFHELRDLINNEVREGIEAHINWGKGYIYWTPSGYVPDPEKAAKRKMKLGKWLRKKKVSKELMKAFETRELPKWEWCISTHPFDVLTMSFKRPWTSCMRPGGAAELGPLTDMAAGTAVMFFYRPGADKPCGRTLLRPALDGKARIILWAGRVYGCGPKKIDVVELRKDLAKKTRHNIPVGNAPICPYGRDAAALTRNIYSDSDREYCSQENAEYETAYARLLDAGWPPSKLDIGDLPERSAAVKDLVKVGGKNEKVEYARSLIDNAFDAWGMEPTLPNLLSIDTEQLVDEDYEYLRDELGIDINDNTDIYAMVEERLEEMLTERFYSRPIRVLLLREIEDEDDRIDIESELEYERGNAFRAINDYDESYIDTEGIEPAWLIAAHTDFDLDEVAKTAKKYVLEDIEVDPNNEWFSPSDFDWTFHV